MSKKIKRYFYYIAQVNANYEATKEIIIKATGVTEALSLTLCKFNDKLDYDEFSDYSENTGLTIRRIKKRDISNFPDAKRMKNINFERSKLKAFDIIENGIDWTSKDRYLTTVYAKNKKEAIKIANKQGGYGIGKYGFVRIEKTKNDYK